MFSSEGYYGDEAEGEPVPGLDRVRGPVAAVVALRGYAFVALQRTREVWKQCQPAQFEARDTATHPLCRQQRRTPYCLYAGSAGTNVRGAQRIEGETQGSLYGYDRLVINV